MKKFTVTALTTAALVVLSSQLYPSFALQTKTAVSQAPDFTVSISLQNSHIVIGGEPRIALDVQNISAQSQCLSTSLRALRIHLVMASGEPLKTEFHRHLLGEYRAGDGPELDEGPIVCTDIDPGSEITRHYFVRDFYDLSLPGAYKVDMEIFDEGSHQWLRTNSVSFEVRPNSK